MQVFRSKDVKAGQGGVREQVVLKRGEVVGGGGVRSSDSGVEGAPLVPLHVPNAPHRLDLSLLSSKLRAVLVLALLKQVLVASVSWILVAHPAVSRIRQRSGEKKERQREREIEREMVKRQRPLSDYQSQLEKLP